MIVKKPKRTYRKLVTLLDEYESKMHKIMALNDFKYLPQTYEFLIDHYLKSETCSKAIVELEAKIRTNEAEHKHLNDELIRLKEIEKGNNMEKDLLKEKIQSDLIIAKERILGMFEKQKTKLECIASAKYMSNTLDIPLNELFIYIEELYKGGE